MENATEALLIAGGTFIAIIIISLLAYSFNNASYIPQEQVTEQDIGKLAEWNAEWEAYDKKMLYGTSGFSSFFPLNYLNNQLKN